MKLPQFISQLLEIQKQHGGDLDVFVDDREAYICYINPIAIPNKKPYVEICPEHENSTPNLPP